MKYQFYQLTFPYGVRFGSGSPDGAQNTFCADTLFSALCMEAARQGEPVLEAFARYVREDRLRFSDAFPFLDGRYFIPKPMLPAERRAGDRGDSQIKKVYKKLKYIPAGSLDAWLNGEYSPEAAQALEDLGSFQTKTAAAVRGLEASMPYRVRFFRFQENGGLYLLCGYEKEDEKQLFEALLEALSFSGIGGKRSSGLGRFRCRKAPADPAYLKRLEAPAGKWMTLSVSLPEEEEMKQVLDGADYLLVRRGGFVASERYASEWSRKKDAYLFAAGSCFACRYRGQVLDVSAGGAHPVYRYAKPIFLGVDL